MKNVFIALVFLLGCSTSFAKGVEVKNFESNPMYSTNTDMALFSKKDTPFASCTIKTGTQIVSNGEVVYEEISTLHIDGMSCEQFFSMLMQVF